VQGQQWKNFLMTIASLVIDIDLIFLELISHHPRNQHGSDSITVVRKCTNNLDFERSPFWTNHSQIDVISHISKRINPKPINSQFHSQFYLLTLNIYRTFISILNRLIFGLMFLNNCQ
jgi:hypothetical protein